MSRLTITDERLEAELKRTTGPVAVHTADGRIVGIYTPIDPADLQPRISEEELRRREQDTTVKVYTTEELLAKLRAQ